MVASKTIESIGETIARKFSPERVVLFGSYAYGSPGQDSDIDLFVVMSHEGVAARKAAEIRLALPTNLPIDVIVRSPRKVKERLRMHDSFISDVMRNGRVLYAGSDQR
jgi:predicted nucleotidyltransferase